MKSPNLYMIRKEKRRKILNPKILAKNNIKVNLVGNRVIFMEISKQVMIFIKNIQISNLSKIARIVQRKISIHLGEIFMGHTLVIKINGSKLIKKRNKNKKNKIKNKNKNKRVKGRSHGMVDIQKKKKTFLEIKKEEAK